MIDDEMVDKLQKMGFKNANNWTVKYRRRRLGLKKYLYGDVLKHKAWVRTQAIKKYGHACELCNYSLTIETHHVIPKYQGGLHEIENLMVLCPNCRALITRRQIDRRKHTEIPQVRKFIKRKLEDLSTRHFVGERWH